MKRNAILAAVAAILICVCLTACAGKTSAKAGNTRFNEQSLVLNIGDKAYALGIDAAPVLETLGAGYEYSEAISCLYDGMDKTFIYPGVSVYTIPDGDRDLVEMYELTDGTYTVACGIRVGDTIENAEKLLGDEWFDDGYVTYAVGNDPEDYSADRLQLYVTDGIIQNIYLFAPGY